ncbi:hypothetical protein SCLCIDRAFT_111995 [Scleroderma citrinum Foug A]|uniref:Uncharacterized protein n=1 Tax=Scleroderma citrinum Foug A TaxID=1036808 RepID=A0A0C2ZWH8_9AGAM|nr:hypothetical protein SCLCIDRAFT_111995 [Scleroderma citrinum Foug A]
MAYVNPSCLMLDPSGPGSIHHYSVVSNPPPHPSAMHAEMPEYWVFPDRRSAVRLPRRHEQSPPQESFPPITFSVDGWPGVRVRDVLNHRVVVDRPYDTPMAHFGWRSTVVNLEWPGYSRRTFQDPQNARIDVMPGNRPMNRHRLAEEVCGTLQNYWVYNLLQNHRPAPGYERWALDDRNINPDKVVLLSIHYYRNQWVPEFYIFE